MKAVVALFEREKPGGGSKRKWLFRLAALLMPVFAAGLLEGALRLAGYGYPVSFFVRQEVDRDFMSTNPAFGWRFFPRSLARSPAPGRMKALKPADTYRIFLFGESAALGDPRPAYGAGRYLEVLLRERFPAGDFEVVPVAMTAINSHALLQAAREVVQYQGDLWIVYAGNNELAGPFGANTVFGPEAPPNWLARSYLTLQRFRAGQLLVELAGNLRPGNAVPDQWDGLRMFQEKLLDPSDPRKERVYRNFQKNLADIADAGLRAGVPVILSSVACNLKDSAPFGSLHFPPAELLQAGGRHLESGAWSEAVVQFEEATRSSPLHAASHFQLAQARHRTGQHEAAGQSFRLACDLDATPLRADSRINLSINEVARQFQARNVFYVDAGEALAALCPWGYAGEEAFLDHVHFNFEGNYFLARRFAEQVATLLPSDRTQGQASSWASQESCAQQLGLTDWNRATVLESMLKRLSVAPFTNQVNHADRMRHLARRHNEARSRSNPQNREAARSTYEEAIRQRPDDPWLHHNYAEFLTAVGDLPEATSRLKKARDLLPDHYAAHFHIGRLLARQKRFAEARESLEVALRLRPDFGEAQVEMGQVLTLEGKFEAALEAYAAARKLRPNDATLYLLGADVQARQNRHEEAILSLREAIRIEPSYWEANYRLGVELALRKRFSEAQRQFEEAIRLRPGHALSHLNLAIALARQERLDAALEAIGMALELDPEQVEARELAQTLRQLKSASPPQK
jgi:tetratricopeptide (TPR) repeat protein